MTEVCDVNGCDSPALVDVLPTYGQTDHHAYRCRDCLMYDLEREWFGEWRQKINNRDHNQIGQAENAGKEDP